MAVMPMLPCQRGPLPSLALLPAHHTALLGKGWGSTCTKEDSSWLQAFSKLADFYSIFCCLGQKPSPCSSWSSHPAGMAPL